MYFYVRYKPLNTCLDNGTLLAYYNENGTFEIIFMYFFFNLLIHAN